MTQSGKNAMTYKVTWSAGKMQVLRDCLCRGQSDGEKDNSEELIALAVLHIGYVSGEDQEGA